jgi:putative peptidoglycan lipid II flippase
MAPRVLGLAATQINFYFIAIFFASSLGSGAISALSFAWLITMTPLGVIGMAISTAAFPTLAEQAANADARLAETLRRALRLILFLSLPAGLGLAILAKPLVVVLLQRGAFDIESTELTAQALLFYAPALFAHSGIEILSRGFYALGDTKTPVAIAVAAMIVNLVLAALLVGPWELRGLALALSLATALEFLLLAAIASKRIPGLMQVRLADGIYRIGLASLALFATTAGTLALLRYGLGLDLATTWPALTALVLCTGVGGLTYLAAGLALNLDEVGELLARVLPRRFFVRFRT